MQNPSYLSSRSHNLAYHRYSPTSSASPTSFDEILFLGGFMSDMQGSKALFLEQLCQTLTIPYTRFDYMGHGQSDGQFTQGNIGLWVQNTLDIIDKITTGKLLIVGSSMGGWIMLHTALQRQERIAALIGIAAAPDFTENLIWNTLTPQQQQHLQRGYTLDMSGECHDPDPSDMPYPITMQLIEDGRLNLLLTGDTPLPLPFPIRLLHGMKDVDVPHHVAIKLIESIDCPDARLILDLHGDHRMSTPSMLALLEKTIKEIMAI